MSRANESAFPVTELRNGNGDVVQYAAPGLTIRELATLTIYASAVSVPKHVAASLPQHLAAAAKCADEFVAWLDRGGK